MTLLLDTHALLWWLADDARLGSAMRSRIADRANTVQVSVVSLWEIVIKARLGKLRAEIEAVERSIEQGGLVRLAITSRHLATLAALAGHHRDPFDHLLVAQAISEGATFVSNDAAMSRYPVMIARCAG